MRGTNSSIMKVIGKKKRQDFSAMKRKILGETVMGEKCWKNVVEPRST